MELRSSRSRSKTPFSTHETFDKEVIERGNHVEKSVYRSTRRTTLIKTNENATSSTDEYSASYNVKPTRRSTRSEKSLQNKLYRTSDYSSEDGENEVSSTRIINQNERNQLIEDARTTVNGSSEVSALDLYKKSGRYWDVYPKTDWTYSQHSKDRVEIAPGVVAMPNMSRKTIHSLDESSSSLYSENVSHKNINTESSYLSRYTSLESEGLKPKNLFNNNKEDNYHLKKYTYTRWKRFKRTVSNIFTSIFAVFYYTYAVQTKWFSYVHWLTSKVMLMDTWLLWKTRSSDKTKKVVALCLIPLLLLGGWWLMSGLGNVLYTSYLNYTSPSKISAVSLEANIDSLDNNLYGNEQVTQPTESVVLPPIPVIEEKIIKITEKIIVEPPNASEVAESLSKEQLEAIASALRNSFDLNERINSDEFFHKIINNPSFQNVIKKYTVYQKEHADVKTDGKLEMDILNEQQKVISRLETEINDIKDNMIIAEKLRKNQNARLTFEMQRCCRKPVINIEGYVENILTKVLNDPSFLNNQEGLKTWLHSLFVAKQDLEYRLSNITAKMNSYIVNIVEDNSKILMDEISRKVIEVNSKIDHVHVNKREVTSVDTISDDQIKKIVKNALAVYDADKTGLVDYAMETMGGQILTTRCTENYHYGKAVVSVLGIPLWYPVNSPRTVITPSMHPGECWAFQNFPGFVVIKLSDRIKIEAFSVEHISRLLVPDGKIDSAPKDFEVYGLTVENDRDPVLLGTYVYDYDGEPLQFFPVKSERHIFDMIEIRIVSNHGNPNYTCLYRFRVHGKLPHGD